MNSTRNTYTAHRQDTGERVSSPYYNAPASFKAAQRAANSLRTAVEVRREDGRIWTVKYPECEEVSA